MYAPRNLNVIDCVVHSYFFKFASAASGRLFAHFVRNEGACSEIGCTQMYLDTGVQCFTAYRFHGIEGFTIALQSDMF